MNLHWQDYCDKIYGCYTGKSVACNIGAPYEGYKGKLHVNYDPVYFAKPIPCENLDIQLIWLDVIEKTGVNFTASDLAKALYTKCPYSSGSLAYFKKNYALGLLPPLTGKFNNGYCKNDLGSVTRSEFWACLAPGNPDLAIQLSSKDSMLDHSDDAAVACAFMAVLECLAFSQSGKTPEALIIQAVKYIDNKSRFAGLVNNVVAWCEESKESDYIFGRILREYGHPNYSDIYQNMGIILLALILGKGHFINSIMLALNCGFDTTYTCGAVGSVIGILEGGRSLSKKYNLPEQTYICGVNVSRISNRIFDLANDVALAGLFFRDVNKKVTITDYIEDHIPTVDNVRALPIEFKVKYEDDDPTIAPGETKKITISFDSIMKIKASGSIKITAPQGFTIYPEEKKFKIGGIFSQQPDFFVTCSKDIPVLMEKNIFRILVTMDNNDCYRYAFGVVGTTLGKVYGPFWENTTRIAPPGNDESFYDGFGRFANDSIAATTIRDFKMNMQADWECEYLEEQLLGDCLLPDGLIPDPAYRGFNTVLRKDLFSFEDFMSNSLPCVIYYVRDIYAPENMDVCLQIGYSNPFRLWASGNLIAFSDHFTNWTSENIHILDLHLNKGINRFVMKLSRTGKNSDFSLVFTKGGPETDIITCLGSCKQ